MRTLAELVEEALRVQDACNPLGVSKSFATAVQELKDRLDADGLPSDTDAIRTHPVFLLWVDKLYDMTGLRRDGSLTEAYTKCIELSHG